MVPPADLPLLFLRYDYPEAQALAKELLGLNAAVLVATLVFADRIVGGPAHRSGYSPGKLTMAGAWSTFLVAIAISGLAICGLALAAGRAAYGGDFLGPAMRAYAMLLGAGVLSMLGLMALVAAAVMALRLREPPGS